ncbi:glycosyltransferase [Micromonospora zamorensis]|uniref:glycosyltransferase n=1 Tax=Micromonospora zamorensis TaxID=709883 RepID=UPI002E18DFA2|nr:glycosyltransferase [Micromonospora zamorensis]WTE89612.1 glycosyltransferase [Micromonospora zamorensis]
MAQSLAVAGHDVVIGSGETEPPTPTLLGDVEGPGSVRHVGLRERPAADGNPVAKALQLVVRLGQRTVDWLDAQPTRPRCVIVYGGGAQYMARVGRWCRRNGVPLVADVVEWYAPHQLAGGALGPVHLSAKLALRHCYPRCQGIIAISSLLERHYRARGCHVLRVPPTTDVLSIKTREPVISGDRSRVEVVYFGSPGRKDLLAPIVRAAGVVGAVSPLILSIYGPSIEQIRGLLGGAELPDSVRALGRVPQQDVEDIVRRADFSVLVRPSARFTHAGFPTKFVESLACGTPVIANLTSDIGRYLRDGQEGLVCAGRSPAELEPVLRRAAGLSDPARQAMRTAARATAETAFDHRRYAQPLAVFLDSLPSGR